jgi:acyl-CoA dehydrogenase
MADTTFLSWPFFDDAHRDFAKAFAAWVEREIAPHQDDEHDVDALSKRFVRAMGDAGWLEYVVPAAYGGKHKTLDVRSLCIARETLARTTGLADFAFAMQGLGSASITLYGSDELKSAYLPKVAAGTQVAAFALSEPEGGSDVAAMTTSARRDGNHFVLNGRKT